MKKTLFVRFFLSCVHESQRNPFQSDIFVITFFHSICWLEVREAFTYVWHALVYIMASEKSYNSLYRFMYSMKEEKIFYFYYHSTYLLKPAHTELEKNEREINRKSIVKQYKNAVMFFTLPQCVLLISPSMYCTYMYISICGKCMLPSILLLYWVHEVHSQMDRNISPITIRS